LFLYSFKINSFTEKFLFRELFLILVEGDFSLGNIFLKKKDMILLFCQIIFDSFIIFWGKIIKEVFREKYISNN